MKHLSRSFYLRPTICVARDLLGKIFFRQTDHFYYSGRIVEVEAYCQNDPASHSFRRRTRRNEVMFGEGGHLYVYFTYGMHFCANIVTGREGIGEAVLIRAVEPLVGINVMVQNRFPHLPSLDFKTCLNLTNGPAKFCQAFKISKSENGIDLMHTEIFIADARPIPLSQIKCSSRIGIQQGKNLQWRYFIKNNLWVSR